MSSTIFIIGSATRSHLDFDVCNANKKSDYYMSKGGNHYGENKWRAEEKKFEPVDINIIFKDLKKG